MLAHLRNRSPLDAATGAAQVIAIVDRRVAYFVRSADQRGFDALEFRRRYFAGLRIQDALNQPRVRVIANVTQIRSKRARRE